LVLGWNEVGPDLLEELELEPRGRYDLEIISRDARASRDCTVKDHHRLELRSHAQDPLDHVTAPDFEPARFDRFLLLADRGVDAESSDVRTLSVALALLRRSEYFRPGAGVLVELLEPENQEVLPALTTLVTPHLAADSLASLALIPAAKESLRIALHHQSTFVTRVLEVDPIWAEDEVALALELRRSGHALLRVLPAQPGVAQRQVLICESISRMGDSILPTPPEEEELPASLRLRRPVLPEAP